MREVLAEMYEAKGQWEEAIAELEQVVKASADPFSTAEMKRRLARWHIEAGSRTRPRRILTKALDDAKEVTRSTRRCATWCAAQGRGATWRRGRDAGGPGRGEPRRRQGLKLLEEALVQQGLADAGKGVDVAKALAEAQPTTSTLSAGCGTSTGADSSRRR